MDSLLLKLYICSPQVTVSTPVPIKQATKCPYSYSLIHSKHFQKILLSTNYAKTIFSTMPIVADTSTHCVPTFSICHSCMQVYVMSRQASKKIFRSVTRSLRSSKQMLAKKCLESVYESARQTWHMLSHRSNITDD